MNRKEKEHTVAIVIPCYNEALRLPVSQLERYAERTSNTRFVLVNDGSSDGTLALLRSIETSYPDVISVIDQQPNAGKGEAVRRGLLFAFETECDYAGFWDADLSTPLEAIADFCEKLDAVPTRQMVLGARVKLLGRDVSRSTVRHLVGRVFATAASFALSLPIYDSQCGAKLFRNTEQMRRLFEGPFLSKWIFDVELLARYEHAMGWDRRVVESTIYELPLSRWNDVAGSKLRPTDMICAVVDLARIVIRYRLSSSRSERGRF